MIGVIAGLPNMTANGFKIDAILIVNDYRLRPVVNVGRYRLCEGRERLRDVSAFDPW